jgi:hypothetical protein
MVVMKCTPASYAPEKNIFGIVDQTRVNVDDWINAVVFVTLLLFLRSSFSVSEWGTAWARFFTILAASMVWSCGILTLWNIDAATALQDKVILCYFCDQVLASTAVPETGLVIHE